MSVEISIPISGVYSVRGAARDAFLTDGVPATAAVTARVERVPGRAHLLAQLFAAAEADAISPGADASTLAVYEKENDIF